MTNNYLYQLTWEELLEAYKFESKKINKADRAQALKAIEAEIKSRLNGIKNN